MTRFFTGNGRYEILPYSRYKRYTYGGNSFSTAEEDIPTDQAHGSYGALLFDKRWSTKRAAIIQRDNNCCRNCGGTENLQVHHRQYHFVKALQQYKAPWDYEDFLMITFCERCHSKGHSKYKVPTIYV